MADGSEFVKTVKGSIDYLPPYGQFRMTIIGDTIHYIGIDEDNKEVPHFEELIIKLDKKELKTIGLQSGEQLHWVKKRVAQSAVLE